MTNFTFQTTKSILSEVGASAKVGGLLADMGVTKAMFVTDKGVNAVGLLETALNSAEAAGIAVSVYEDTVADPPAALVLDATAHAKRHGIDGVVGIGGGSSMDIAKLVAFLAVSDQSLDDIYGVGFAKGGRLPLIQVPTTAGTGSEVTPLSIITTGESQKKGVVSPILLPDWAVLDADLTLGLPTHVTAATGVDAMVHALEAYTTKLRKNPVSDTLACEALRLLGSAIETACADGANKQARADMLLGAMLAGMAFANAPCAAVHALAYPIGGHFHVPHGLSNSLMLPHVMRFNAPEAAGMYAHLAPIIFPSIQHGSDAAMSDALINGFEDLIAKVGLKNKLTQVGINHNNVPLLAEDAMKQERLLINNPREITYDDAVAIYEAAL